MYCQNSEGRWVAMRGSSRLEAFHRYLSNAPGHASGGCGIDPASFLLSGAAQTLQAFMWQVDMRSIVLCVRDCLSVLLYALVATALCPKEAQKRL